MEILPLAPEWVKERERERDLQTKRSVSNSPRSSRTFAIVDFFVCLFLFMDHVLLIVCVEVKGEVMRAETCLLE